LADWDVAMNSGESDPKILFVSADLFFASQVTGIAENLGIQIDIEGDPAEALARRTQAKHLCVILDLTLSGLVVADFTTSPHTDPRPTVIAYGPHVQTVRLQEARDAGCDDVLPRSKFAAALPGILKRCLSA
jgi:CheY-like chemotaxis protein